MGEAERAALSEMAREARGELIEPAFGVCYESEAMDKVTTAPDPVQGGNVFASLMLGLRLAGSDGALVFPKVKVAVG